MAKNRVLSAPSVTPAEQEIIEVIKKSLTRLEVVPGLLHRLKTTLADLQQRVSALEQKQPAKSPKRTR